DTKYLDMKKFLTLPPKEGAVSMDKRDLQNFCDMVVGSTAGRVIVAKIKGDKASMEDADFGNDYEKPLPAKLPDFSFNPAFMGKLLKSLPDDELTFVKDANKYFVTGESDFVSLI